KRKGLISVYHTYLHLRMSYEIDSMNRRAGLSRLLYIDGGTVRLPACYRRSGRASSEVTNIVIDEEDEILLAELVDALIPPSDTPGGKELLLHLFVLKMVDDCYTPDDQKIFTAGLTSFSACAEEIMGKDFMQLEQERRIAFLEAIDEISDEDVKRFYAMAKHRTIQGYLNSKYVMANLIKYELVPGRYNGYAKMM